MPRTRSAQIWKGLAALALLLPFASAACGAPEARQALRQAPPPRSYPPVHLRLIEADRYTYTTPQSMCSSLLTSEVVVSSHGPAHWNTANGQRPPISSSNEIFTQGYRILTPVLFASQQPLIDHRPSSTKEYVQLSGSVGQDSMIVDPFPQLKDGGHYVVVFAPGSLPAGQGTTTAWLVVFDAFPVDAHGMVLLQAAGPTNEPGPGQPQPEIKVSLTDLKQQLAACK